MLMEVIPMRTVLFSLYAAGFVFAGMGGAAASETDAWKYKDDMISALAKRVPEILKTQDPATGRFGTGIWIVQDQHPMWALAVAWATPNPDNSSYHSPEVLERIMKAGDALIEAQKPSGMWIFRKKDASEWGDIYMPWTYSRWVRAYSLIKDAMPPDRRVRWEKALILGYENIAKKELDEVQNIPAHHAMGLYCAGKAFNRPEWCDTAAAYMKRVIAAQDPGGFWSEHNGPVVGYNYVYMDAVGTYYGMSHDAAMVPALERGVRFHRAFLYPDGSNVETIDERQIYHEGPVGLNAGFGFTPEGRGILRQIWDRSPKGGSTDVMASLIQYGDEGSATPPPEKGAKYEFVLGDNDAMTQRQGPWFVCLSAYHCPVPASRWIQDRQNFVSLFHEKTGLILGGGNTKLQPYWSSFCAGNPALLKHKAGDEEPIFIPPPGVTHVPEKLILEPETRTLAGSYDSVGCQVKVDFLDDARARLVFTVDSGIETTPVIANVTFLPKAKQTWETATGKKGVLLEADPFRFTAAETGEWFGFAGWRATVPAGGTVQWPVYGHDPYKKAGQGSFGYARIVLTLPFSKELRRQEVIIEVP